MLAYLSNVYLPLCDFFFFGVKFTMASVFTTDTNTIVQ